MASKQAYAMTYIDCEWTCTTDGLLYVKYVHGDQVKSKRLGTMTTCHYSSKGRVAGRADVSIYSIATTSGKYKVRSNNLQDFNKRQHPDLITMKQARATYGKMASKYIVFW
jgi:hypothetical protein